LGSRVKGLEVQGLHFGIEGLGCRVWGLGFGAQGLEFVIPVEELG
jgi:hypothetical protein